MLAGFLEAAAGALLFLILGFALKVNATQNFIIKPDEVSFFVMDAIAGGVITFVLRLFRQTQDRLAAAQEDFSVRLVEVTSRVDQSNQSLTTQLEALERLVSSQEILNRLHTFMQSYDRHFDFVNSLLKKRSYTEAAMLSDVSRLDFYKILMDALRGTGKWEAVHQGEISLLCETRPLRDPSDEQARKEFLNTLRRDEFASIKKRRIIILSKKNESDLRNESIMADYWESTGKVVESYYVNQEDLQEFLDIDGDDLEVLHDCALHDGEMLLHYNRTNRTVLLAGREAHRAKIIRSIFEAIDEKNSALKYGRIEGPNAIAS